MSTEQAGRRSFSYSGQLCRACGDPLYGDEAEVCDDPVCAAAAGLSRHRPFRLPKEVRRDATHS